MNRQAPIIIAVTNREVRDRLSKLNAAVFGPDNDMDPFYGAPVVLVVLADTTAAMTWKEDGSLVMGNLLNAAHAKGLGSCWIHRAKEVFATEEGKAILRDLGIDDTKYVGIGNCIYILPPCTSPSGTPAASGCPSTPLISCKTEALCTPAPVPSAPFLPSPPSLLFSFCPPHRPHRLPEAPLAIRACCQHLCHRIPHTV